MRKVLLSESAEQTIREAAKDAHPLEVGGVLLGVVADRRPWVTHAIAISPSKPFPNRYVLPSGATHAVVALGQQLDSRIGYLGDWHAHPADTDISPIDESTMKAVTIGTQEIFEPPVFLLARRRNDDYELKAFEWHRGRHRPLDLQRAGELPGSLRFTISN